jgi:lipopolysaccharide export system protein LptC
MGPAHDVGQERVAMMSGLWQRLRKGLDQMALYLPLLVMGLLALGSWSLVRSVPGLAVAPSAGTPRNDPDYILGRFAAQVFDAQGQPVRELVGERARHYPLSDELHVEQVRLEARSASGAQVQAQALRAVAPGHGDRLALAGQVQVVRLADARGARTVFRGEALQVLLDEERLLSDQPVNIVQGHQRYAADRMVLDIRTGQYTLQGRVRVTLAP